MKFKNIMGQVQEMQQKLAEAQEQIERMEVEGQAGGGLVSVTVDGRGRLKKVSIDPSLLKEEEKEVLEDLLVAAANDGANKADAEAGGMMSGVTSGMNLPADFKLPM